MSSGESKFVSVQGSNLVTLKDTKASAMLQDDGSILCNHQELSSLRKKQLHDMPAADGFSSYF